MVIRGIRKSDVIAMCGQKFPAAIRGVTVEHDGKVLGIAGVMYTHPMQAFSVMTPDMLDYPVRIMKAAHRLRDVLDTIDAPIYAIASTEYATSREFLKRVGFVYLKTTEQGEVYQWSR